MGESVDKAKIKRIARELLDKSAEIEFEYMWKDMVVARVKANAKTDTVEQEVLGDLIFDTPIFRPEKNIKSLMEFFEKRCFPRTRYNCDQLLKDLGLTRYNPYAIVRKTRGRLWDDYYWIRFKGDNVTFDDIKLRD